MPSSTQIIPKHQFPYIETYVNDNTVVSPVVIEEIPQTGFNSIFVFAASRGRDNTIVTKSNTAQFEKEYGIPNFKVYGQAALNAYAALETGETLAHCMRVLPSDANLANALVAVKIKKETESEEQFLEIPTNVKATIALEDLRAVKLTWDTVEDATAYLVCINGDTKHPVTVTGEEYNHTNLLSGTAYSYAVKPIADGKISEYSNAVVITTGSAGNQTASEKEASNEKTTGLTYKFVAVSNDGLKNEDEVFAALNEMREDEEDEEGYITIPLFGVYSLGRGIYGNGFSFRLVNDTTSIKYNKIPQYFFEVFDMDKSSTKAAERFTVSLDPEVLIKGKTQFVTDVLADETSGSQLVGVVGNEDALTEIYDMYTQIEDVVHVGEDQFDLITACDLSGTPIDGLTLESSLEEDGTVDFSTIGGIFLGYGSDGSFTTTNTELHDIIEATYREAFAGNLDKSILSKRAFPCEVLFDANYDLETKIELHNLKTRRGDCAVIIDTGLSTDSQAVLEFMDDEDIAAIDSYTTFIQPGCAPIKDPVTNRTITVTASYFFASKLPTHVRTIGAHVPMVGEDYGLIDNIVRGKFAPVVDYDDVVTKAEYYDKRLNYIERIGKNRFAIGTQTACQKNISDLLEFNNVMTLLNMKRVVESVCLNATYNFAEESDRQRYTAIAKELLSEYSDGCRDFNIEFSATEFEVGRSILHCYLNITFKNMSKNFIVEIDVNPRT